MPDGRLAGRLAGRPAGRLAGKLAGRLAGWLAGWLAGSRGFKPLTSQKPWFFTVKLVVTRASSP